MTATRQFAIESASGFHLRPISLLVELSGRFNSDITVCKDGVQVGARSVMELLLLGAQQGDVLEITAVGADSLEALDAIGQFFAELAESDD